MGDDLKLSVDKDLKEGNRGLFEGIRVESADNQENSQSV
jgi:hypothetical protein